MKKGIAYYRVSTDSQEDNTSLADQQRKVRAYAISQDIEIVHEFSEVASGTNTKRAEYQKMLHYAKSKKNKISAVMVAKLDRAHRHQQNLLNFEAALTQNGVSFLCVSPSIDTSSPIGRMIFQVLGTFAEFEASIIRERMKGGREARLNQGKTAGGQNPVGYTPGWEVDQKEAMVVQDLFRAYIRAGSLAKVAEYAENKGYRTKTGKLYKEKAIQVILRNRAYLGQYSYNGEKEKRGICWENHHEPIIAQSVFGKVAKQLTRNRRKK